MDALHISEDEVGSLLGIDACIDAVEAAFQREDAGLASSHPRRRLYAPDGTLHAMEALDLGLGRAVVKVYTSFATAVRFAVLLFDSGSGALLAVIEGDRLGQLRTGAATGVATRHMARAEASILGMIGAGWQAEAQVAAVAAVRPLREVRAYCRSAERRSAFAARVSQAVGVEVTAAGSAEEAARGADILVTATTSRAPVLTAHMLEPGVHINAIGGNAADRLEVEPAAIGACARVVVDSVEQARVESGELIAAVRARKLRWEAVRELREIVTGVRPGRDRRDEITLFKSLGVALEDVAVASLVHDRAVRAGAGRSIPLWRARS
ncbi:MAG: ornithine cyclodeaminase family protein [Chthonomonadales bacterium]|nr:ornithine cyclodeaminase family protein [Chthonomonadales bacterium]